MIVKLKKISDEIIVCNDGSSDLTGEIAEKMGVIVINHEENLGYGAGISSIIKKSKEIDTDILVTFDADGQHRIEDIKKVYEPIKQNIADIVIGTSAILKPNELVFIKISVEIPIPKFDVSKLEISFLLYALNPLCESVIFSFKPELVTFVIMFIPIFL